MHDLYPGNKYDGEIILQPDNTNILDKRVDPIEVRMRISMVFQKPNPFPKSIYENVAYGLRVRGEKNKRVLDDKVEDALKVPLYGMKLIRGFMISHSIFQVVNNKDFVLLEHWQLILKLCCLMNPPQHLIQ